MKFIPSRKLVAFGMVSVTAIALVYNGVTHLKSAEADMKSVHISRAIMQANMLQDTLEYNNHRLRSDMQDKSRAFKRKELEKKQAAEAEAAKQAEAEQAKVKQAEAEQAKAKQVEAEQVAQTVQATPAAAPAAAPATQNIQAAQVSADEPSYYVGGYTSASSSAVQAVIDSNLMLWASISDIPTSGGVALFGHTDFSGRASAGGWIAGAGVGQIVNISGANYRITSKYIVIHNSAAQYDAVTGAQPGEVVFHTCATLDQGSVWILRTQRM